MYSVIITYKIKVNLVNRFLKPVIILIAASFVSACTTTSVPKYNPKEFDTENYQKNVDNAVDATDLLSDFDKSKIPAATLEASDVSNLVQADLYYNQGSYANAYSLYSGLAYKYKDPRIIYKAIICLEHVGNTQTQAKELNGLIGLFIQVDPNSNIAKLFQIKQALNNNDVDLAEKNLDQLMSDNDGKGRVIFLFISSMISNDLNPNANKSMSKFADYVASEYPAYPEAHLCSILAYSVANDEEGLSKQINRVHKYYPNWYIPFYWSSDILVRQKHSDTLIKVLEPLVTESNPDKVLQNIYVAALIGINQMDKAKSYLQSQIDSINRDNVLINLGIVAVKSNDSTGAISYFNQAKIEDKVLYDVVTLVKASIYDNQNQTALAIKNYQQITNTQYLSSIANIMLLNDYLAQNNLTAVNALLNKLALEGKMNEKQTILFKSGYYMSESRFDIAYNLVQSKLSLYSKDQDYIYQYTALTSMVGKTKQAISLYKDFIYKYPNIAYGYNDLAYVYAEQTTEYKQAKKYAEMAYKLSPTDPNVLDTLGWVYYKLGDYNKALPFIKTSYEVNYDPESARHLFAVYMAMNRPDLAKKIVVLSKDQLQKQLKQQLVQRSLVLLIFVQLGIEAK